MQRFYIEVNLYQFTSKCFYVEMILKNSVIKLVIVFDYLIVEQ